MSANCDPDESIVLDLGIFRRSLIRRLRADGIVCEQDMAVLRAFDGPHKELGQRLKVRKAFESIMRNGVTRRTTDKAREAGLRLVVTNNQIASVSAFADTDPLEAA